MTTLYKITGLAGEPLHGHASTIQCEVGARGGGTDSAPRIGTPPAFRDLLMSIARSAPSTQEVA